MLPRDLYQWRRRSFSPALGPQTRETAGTVALSSVAGTIAPVDFAGISVPVVAGMKFSAVAEVHSSAVDVEDDTSVVRASEQWSDGRWDPRKSPGMVDIPMTEISVPEPLEHLVMDVDLDGRPMEGIPACQCGWYVLPMRPVSEAGLSGFRV